VLYGAPNAGHNRRLSRALLSSGGYLKISR
jgi:hypothetical protein